MASTIKVDKIEGSTGSTITVPTGQTYTITDGVGVASGGTGLSSFTAGDVLYASGATTLVKLAKGTAEQILSMNSGATAPEWATAAPTAGGTGQTAWATGDLLYANGTNTLTKLAKGSGSDTLKMNSGATAPEWVTVAAASSDFVLVTTATGGGTAALAMDSCFSATYDNYLIIGNIFTSATTMARIRIQNASNTEQTADYYGAGVMMNRSSGASGGPTTKAFWSDSNIFMDETIETDAANFGQYIVYVSNPFVSTCHTCFSVDFHSFDGSNFRTVKGGYSHRLAQENAGFRFYVSSGNITTSSKVRIYGLK